MKTACFFLLLLLLHQSSIVSLFFFFFSSASSQPMNKPQLSRTKDIMVVFSQQLQKKKKKALFPCNFPFPSSQPLSVASKWIRLLLVLAVALMSLGGQSFSMIENPDSSFHQNCHPIWQPLALLAQKVSPRPPVTWALQACYF